MDEGKGLSSKTEVYKARDNGSQAVVQGLPRGTYMTTEGPKAKQGKNEMRNKEKHPNIIVVH